MPRRFTGTVPRPQSRRFRVSVPDADESVLAWIGAQSDLSASVRSLIREAIERHGYRDATCYPVQQQPRRGRPPKSTELTEQAEQLETVDGHPIPERIAALVEPKMELLMVRASDDSRDEGVDVPRESEVSDDTVDDSDDTAGAEIGSANENAIEDMLGALR
jgi:hypothetical protein